VAVRFKAQFPPPLACWNCGFEFHRWIGIQIPSMDWNSNSIDGLEFKFHRWIGIQIPSMDWNSNFIDGLEFKFHRWIGIQIPSMDWNSNSIGGLEFEFHRWIGIRIPSMDWKPFCYECCVFAGSWEGVGTSNHNWLCILFIMLTTTCFGHCGPSSGHKNVYRGKLYRVWS